MYVNAGVGLPEQVVSAGLFSEYADLHVMCIYLTQIDIDYSYGVAKEVSLCGR